MAFQCRGFSPHKDVDWGSAVGFEAQLRLWSTPEIAIALAVGQSTWKAVEEYSEDDDGYSFVATSVRGDTTLTPVGISAIYRGRLSHMASLIFEAGLRYGFTESDIVVETAYADDYGEEYFKDTIEVDDTFLAVFGVSLNLELSETISLEGGFGYQADLLDPHERLYGEDLGQTSFDAGYANIGLNIAF